MFTTLQLSWVWKCHCCIWRCCVSSLVPSSLFEHVSLSKVFKNYWPLTVLQFRWYYISLSPILPVHNSHIHSFVTRLRTFLSPSTNQKLEDYGIVVDKINSPHSSNHNPSSLLSNKKLSVTSPTVQTQAPGNVSYVM